MIDKVSQSYNHIIYNNNYTRDYFIVDYIWCNEGENTYIKLIDNPLKFNNYLAYIKFIKIKDYNSNIAFNILHNNLYHVNIDVNGIINDCIYLESKSGVQIPNNSILRIKMYYQGSNKYNDICEEIKHIKPNCDFKIIPIKLVKSIKEDICKLM
jgi:hypothetical protein